MFKAMNFLKIKKAKDFIEKKLKRKLETYDIVKLLKIKEAKDLIEEKLEKKLEEKLKRKLEAYREFTYAQIVLEALKLKGDLKRKHDLEILKQAERDANLLFNNNDPYFRNTITLSLSKLLSIPQIDILNEDIDKTIISIIPKEIIKEQELLPISKEGNKLIIAISNPLSINTLDNLSQINGYITHYVLCDRSDINKTIASIPGFKNNKSANAQGKAALKPETPRSKDNVVDYIVSQKEEKAKNPIYNLSPTSVIDTTLKKAISLGASDIHFEYNARGINVRFRIDGMLYDQLKIPGHLATSTISRIKVMSNLDITETRVPQDGRITTNINGKEYHLRVSTMPNKMGENVVFRIIPKGNIFEGLSHLGIDKEDELQLKSIISKPHGMVLVTGPIGSGKTTTLYTALNELDISKNKVVTIEDPVECLLSGVTQVEVDPKIEVNFVNSLRSVLRQDANILMVGEIRDDETAKIAVRAALTGQLLFSTLHAVDTASAVTTLQNFDVPPFLIASALNGIIAQRLVRKICNHCKTEYRPSGKLLQQLRVSVVNKDIKFAYGKGCERCNGIGYHGRTAIFEILQITETIKDAIINQAKERVLRKLSCQEGLKTLREGGIAKITKKITTPDEVMREIFLTGGKL